MKSNLAEVFTVNQLKSFKEDVCVKKDGIYHARVGSKRDVSSYLLFYPDEAKKESLMKGYISSPKYGSAEFEVLYYEHENIPFITFELEGADANKKPYSVDRLEQELVMALKKRAKSVNEAFSEEMGTAYWDGYYIFRERPGKTGIATLDKLIKKEILSDGFKQKCLLYGFNVIEYRPKSRQ